MNTPVFKKCVICGLLFLTVAEPPLILLASQDFKKEVPHLTTYVTKFLPFHEKSPHAEFHHTEHTHQEDKSPSTTRTTFKTTSGGTISQNATFTADGIIVDSNGTVTI